MPLWLDAVSIAFLILGFVCAAIVAADVMRRPPLMRIMAVVWPITALFGTVFLTWFFSATAAPRRVGRTIRTTATAARRGRFRSLSRSARPIAVPAAR